MRLVCRTLMKNWGAFQAVDRALATQTENFNNKFPKLLKTFESTDVSKNINVEFNDLDLNNIAALRFVGTGTLSSSTSSSIVEYLTIKLNNKSEYNIKYIYSNSDVTNLYAIDMLKVNLDNNKSMKFKFDIIINSWLLTDATQFKSSAFGTDVGYGGSNKLIVVKDLVGICNYLEFRNLTTLNFKIQDNKSTASTTDTNYTNLKLNVYGYNENNFMI